MADIESVFKGTMWSIGSHSIHELQVKVDTDTVNTTNECRANPSRETCNFQEFTIYAGNDVVTYETSQVDFPLPNSMHYTVLSDYTVAPSLIVIEGRFDVVAANAESLFAAYSIEGLKKRDLSDIRTVYFHVIQERDEIWLIHWGDWVIYLSVSISLHPSIRLSP